METLYEDLKERLAVIANEEQNILKQSEKCIAVVLDSITQLKKWIVEHPFTHKQEEIHFFKEIKPRFLSELFYYTSLFNIERNKPIGSTQVQKIYIHKELDKVSDFFDNNREFYQYYRLHATYLDEKYFLRENHEMYLALDKFIYDSDPQFSTGYDYKVARILANEKLIIYLNKELIMLDNAAVVESSKSNLHWTLSKTACIELLYALHSVGAFGKVDLKQIATYFENAFHVDLKNYYRTFLEIRIRKTGRSAFLDLLKERLIQRMDEADETLK
ncbi:RteC domain-containing protein [Xanthocytophaga agilis]|uniref:RteC domain-containing protein n=1 Tax=Xanthocytophaga agilis TaxID=3048010 RepID=A0AAE3R4F7_9BACT|nr:RteC domain-containing protein [Xanthocytophaga agilis]MDJ1503564.1 RteC domain-containing protein [Xanthocytophaga agilis]